MFSLPYALAFGVPSEGDATVMKRRAVRFTLYTPLAAGVNLSARKNAAVSQAYGFWDPKLRGLFAVQCLASKAKRSCSQPP